MAITKVNNAMQDALAAAQPTITSVGTLTSLAVDTITIDGSEIDASGSLIFDVGGNLTINVDGSVVSLADDSVNFGQFFNSGSGDFNIYSPTSNKDIVFRGSDGGTGIIALTLDMSEAGAATFTGVVTANAGVVVDTITIDAGQIAQSSGSLTLDVAGNINLDSDTGYFYLKDGGTSIGLIKLVSNNLEIKSEVSNGDIKFKGNDGGSGITALTLDMSEAGEATFNADIKLGDGKVARFGADQDFRISFDGNNAVLQNVTSDSDITFLGKDGSSAITALRLDMSEAGAAIFNSTVTVGISSAVGIGGSPSDTNSAEVGAGYINLNRDDTASATQIQFSKNGSVAGSIVTTTSTAYNTSSDYRLKENVVPMSGSIDRLKTLKPSRFNFIVDADTTVDGFLAHEAQAVVPECVTGTKDAMKDEEYEVTAAVEEVRDEDDNITTEAADAVMGTRSVPDMQGIDQSKLVPLLVAALQEAVTKIEELTARITALEGE